MSYYYLPRTVPLVLNVSIHQLLPAITEKGTIFKVSKLGNKSVNN